MKHAGPAALDQLEPLLQELRELHGLKEPKRGLFYRGSRAFLHFHEHGHEVYADVRLADDFERYPATTAPQREALMKRVRAKLADGNGPVCR